MWVCSVLGAAEASSSSGEQEVSGGAPHFTRANTLTVGGSQLDGLLEERTRSQVTPPPEKEPKSPGLWRKDGAEGPNRGSEEVRSWSLLSRAAAVGPRWL